MRIKPQFIAVLVFLCSVQLFSQNKLDSSKKDLNSSSASSSGSGSTSNSSSKESSEVDDEELGFFAKVFFDVTFGVFKYGLIGDYKNEDHLHSSLTPYPYYNFESGNYRNVEDSIADYRLRFDVVAKFVYNDNNLFGSHLKGKVRVFQYFSIQTNYHQLFEFNKLNRTTDQLALFYFNVAYDRIRFEKFNLGWTMGASYVGNEVRKGGFSYGLLTEYFMSNHISFAAAIKWSQVNSQPVNAFELESRYHKKRGFFSIGYERLKIGTPSYNFVTLGTGIYF
ncbi:MAG: hypothetical protein CFE23_07105 [Flavobacterium sp. BFFFF1]|uniref:hypothetical protein n=1 Tax=Flavobacterium sp. BFFFF1 TaxID=2015557 RepID=UPI000BCC4D23|nr:hypothetical protein [Flavobacterium sp. BFFFF1]OYU80987.1 MAG: hypothetical protein CFE23_07105 [Flavobacterium sp. BFFFF1]